MAQCTPEEMSRNNLAGCSPFLKPETLVPRKHAIVHMGSGQHGQVLGFTKCRHDLPGGGSCATWFLGMGAWGGGVPSKIFFEKTFTRFYYRPAWQAQADFWEPISLRECPL